MDILPEMDAVILVIDPLPSRLISTYSKIERLLITISGIIPLVNKMNKGVHRGEVARFLGTKYFCTFPFVNPENLYKAEFNCVMPYDIPIIKKETEVGLKKLSDTVFMQ